MLTETAEAGGLAREEKRGDHAIEPGGRRRDGDDLTGRTHSRPRGRLGRSTPGAAP